MANKSTDGRFEVIFWNSSDHFMHPDQDWGLVDRETGKTIATFHGSWMKQGSIQSVDIEGEFVVTRDSENNILSKTMLTDYI